MFFCGFRINLKIKNRLVLSTKRFFLRKIDVFYLIIAEQATLAPAFPAG
jgi:hypothetical protein